MDMSLMIPEGICSGRGVCVCLWGCMYLKMGMRVTEKLWGHLYLSDLKGECFEQNTDGGSDLIPTSTRIRFKTTGAWVTSTKDMR